MSNYIIIRFYNGRKHQWDVIKRGLTEQEAIDHCNDPETSSSTCTTNSGLRRTKRFGDWFDTYRLENYQTKPRKYNSITNMMVSLYEAKEPYDAKLLCE